MRNLLRNLIGLLTALLFPAFAWAQDAKPVPLADYVSFCLVVFERAPAPEIQSKASALGLREPSGMAGAAIMIGKSTMMIYRSAQGNQTVAATFTTFEDGRESECDVNLAVPTERADLEAMQQALDLDGQIVTAGPAIIGHWKMRKRQPPVLLRAIVGKTITTMMLLKFEPTPADAAAQQNH